MNKELGVSLKIPSISTADYPTRLNTVVAGSDVPDIVAAAIFSTTMPNIGDFLNATCADLTPYLSGDAIKEYPNLANLPSTAWPPMVFNNKIMAVPIAAGGVRTSPLLLARWGDLERAGITSISSPDEFMGIAKQLNNPGTRWALGANTFVNWLAMAYGAPNGWRESGGKFTKDYETPEFKEAVAFHRAALGCRAVLSGFGHPVGESGRCAVLRRPMGLLAARELVAGRLSNRLGTLQRGRPELQAARGAALQ